LELRLELPPILRPPLLPLRVFPPPKERPPPPPKERPPPEEPPPILRPIVVTSKSLATPCQNGAIFSTRRVYYTIGKQKKKRGFLKTTQKKSRNLRGNIMDLFHSLVFCRAEAIARSHTGNKPVFVFR
jgi:hypothetical protein